jgi:hypothetical protein
VPYWRWGSNLSTDDKLRYLHRLLSPLIPGLASPPEAGPDGTYGGRLRSPSPYRTPRSRSRSSSPTSWRSPSQAWSASSPGRANSPGDWRVSYRSPGSQPQQQQQVPASWEPRGRTPPPQSPRAGQDEIPRPAPSPSEGDFKRGSGSPQSRPPSPSRSGSPQFLRSPQFPGGGDRRGGSMRGRSPSVYGAPRVTVSGGANATSGNTSQQQQPASLDGGLAPPPLWRSPDSERRGRAPPSRGGEFYRSASPPRGDFMRSASPPWPRGESVNDQSASDGARSGLGEQADDDFKSDLIAGDGAPSSQSDEVEDEAVPIASSPASPEARRSLSVDYRSRQPSRRLQNEGGGGADMVEVDDIERVGRERKPRGGQRLSSGGEELGKDDVEENIRGRGTNRTGSPLKRDGTPDMRFKVNRTQQGSE